MARGLLAVLVLLAPALTACGDEALRAEDPVAASVRSPSPSPSETPGPGVPAVVPWDGEGFAPPVTLDLDGDRVPLAAWTACYDTGCWDGSPAEPYVDVGRRATVPFSFPDQGWEFEATFKEAGVERCGRHITVPVDQTSERTWSIAPVGPAGTWDVDVFGRGPTGDVITTFRWTTTTDGRPAPPASGSAGVLADHDGELDSYGVEIGVRDLAEHPARATASVTVTSASGRSVTIATRAQRECYAEGNLWFTAPDSDGRAATRLGEGPFTYDVELVLDGRTYHGLGEWPTGETEEIAPHVPLTWTPALPSYHG